MLAMTSRVTHTHTKIAWFIIVMVYTGIRSLSFKT